MPKPNKFAPANETATHFKNQRFLYRTEPQTESLFFKLPAELRVEIYKLVLPRSYSWMPGTDYLFPSSQTELKRSKYGRITRFSNHSHFPFTLWEHGEFEILRACRRIYGEAASLFYSENTFDLVMVHESESEPVIRIKILHSTDRLPLRKIECREYFRKSWSDKNYKTISSVKRESLRSIRSWNILIPTHLVTQLSTPAEAEESIEYFLLERPRQQQVYRQLITSGLQKVATLFGNNEENVCIIMLLFEPYANREGMKSKPDHRLVKCVREEMSEWMFESVTHLGGMIDEEELEAWDIE